MKILLLGSSALKIGEAGEFDYSASQAIKAFKEEGAEVILVNPNIATIQTSQNFADKVYFIPIHPHFVGKIIEKELPDAVAISFGGQTALNCGVELFRSGMIGRKGGATLLGTPIESIIATEDRELFASTLRSIGVNTPRSIAASDIREAVNAAKRIGWPVMVRAAYALGGLGSGICRNEDELINRCQMCLSHVPQVLIEECLVGWKEIEYEVVRDAYDNCVTVCNMENVDPIGIHTGESIVTAPSLTLTNEEYHNLRSISIKVVRHLGIIGECNIQFALDPSSDEWRVIEVNARLSRSSALASKATGYPLAFVAAKLILGKRLYELRNAVTQATTAAFEPALDYVVVKFPRWDTNKFKMASRKIGSSMKSVGEVMAIGRNFEEAIQKATRMLAIGAHGIIGDEKRWVFDDIYEEIKNPTDARIFAIAKAISDGIDIEVIHKLSGISHWFLSRINNIVSVYKKLKDVGLSRLDESILLDAKRLGFSDTQISNIISCDRERVTKIRHNLKVRPFVKRIDTLAAEYPAATNYLYLTYNASSDDVEFPSNGSVMVLGSGAYRIGSSVEFDWCSVSAVRTLKRLGYKTIMLNYNPETVSTDYDECDRLYFDEISFEVVSEIWRLESPIGVIISVGGQIPNNLALKLASSGIKILGTSAGSIDTAEDRHKFSSLLDEIGVEQPAWTEASNLERAAEEAKRLGYPVLVRPSYVLSGAAMGVATNEGDLRKFLERAAEVSGEHPVVISKFIVNAKELELDGVAKDGEIVASIISEHIENAGVHSGDATLVVPPQRTYLETARKMNVIAKKVIKALNITGPFNIQFLAKGNEVKVIECNLRASRSFPFVSKAVKYDLIDLATRVMLGREYSLPNFPLWDIDHVGVKAPQFSFARLDGADPTLSVEMASTGEVACFGDDFDEALLKAMIAVGFVFPIKKILLSTGPFESKVDFLESARLLNKIGVKIYATTGTSIFLTEHGIENTLVYWPSDDRHPQAVDLIKERGVDLVINIPKNYQHEELTNGYIIRRAAADFGIPLITNLQLANRFVESIASKDISDLLVKAWDEYQVAR